MELARSTRSGPITWTEVVARRGQHIVNWLALALLIALGIVWQPGAVGEQAREASRGSAPGTMPGYVPSAAPNTESAPVPHLVPGVQLAASTFASGPRE